MARDFARIGTDMPHEDRIRALPVGPAWLYDRLLMSRDMSRCAVVPLRPALWADLASDATPAKVNRWLNTLIEERCVVTDDKYAELFVRTAIRHDRLLAQPNVVAALVSDFRLVASDRIRTAVLVELRRIWGLPDVTASERGGWLLAMGHYPQQTSGGAKAVWPTTMTADALGRLRKAVGTGLAAPMHAALAHAQVRPFHPDEPAGVPAPFMNLKAVEQEARGA